MNSTKYSPMSLHQRAENKASNVTICNKCLQDANPRCHQHHKSRLYAASLLLSKGSKQEFVARFQTSELENWKVSSWQTMTGLNESFWRSASIVSLGRNLHSATDLSLERSAHQDKVEAIGALITVASFNVDPSKRATAKKGRSNFSDRSDSSCIRTVKPFASLRIPSRWQALMTTFYLAERWKWNEDGWSLLSEFRDGVNECCESTSWIQISSASLLAMKSMSPVKLWIQAWTRGAQETLWYPFCSSNSFFSVFVGSPKNLKQLTNAKGEFSIDGNSIFFLSYFVPINAEKKQNKFQLHTNHPPLLHVESDQSHRALKVFCGVASRYQMSRDIFEVQCYTRACVHRSDQSIQWYTVQKIGWNSKINEMPRNA